MSASLVGSEMCIRDRGATRPVRWCDCCRKWPAILNSGLHENPEAYCSLECQQEGDQRYLGQRAEALGH
eukprot:242886-Alexandrium_andersonii.AAC.1